jgi:hypothetical protein
MQQMELSARKEPPLKDALLQSTAPTALDATFAQLDSTTLPKTPQLLLPVRLATLNVSPAPVPEKMTVIYAMTVILMPVLPLINPDPALNATTDVPTVSELLLTVSDVAN